MRDWTKNIYTHGTFILGSSKILNHKCSFSKYYFPSSQIKDLHRGKYACLILLIKIKMLVCICMFQNKLWIWGWLDKIPVPAWVIQMKSLNFLPKHNSLAGFLLEMMTSLSPAGTGTKITIGVQRMCLVILTQSHTPRRLLRKQLSVLQPAVTILLSSRLLSSCLRHALSSRSVTTKIWLFFVCIVGFCILILNVLVQ